MSPFELAVARAQGCTTLEHPGGPGAWGRVAVGVVQVIKRDALDIALVALRRQFVDFQDVTDGIRITFPVLHSLRWSGSLGLSAEETKRGSDNRVAVSDCAVPSQRRSVQFNPAVFVPLAAVLEPLRTEEAVHKVARPHGTALRLSSSSAVVDMTPSLPFFEPASCQRISASKDCAPRWTYLSMISLHSGHFPFSGFSPGRYSTVQSSLRR